MAGKLDDVMAALPKAQRERIEARTMELVTLKDLRQAAQQTQAQLAPALGVGQDTISRLEKRRDMLLSTLRHDAEELEILQAYEAGTLKPVPDAASRIEAHKAVADRDQAPARKNRYKNPPPPPHPELPSAGG